MDLLLNFWFWVFVLISFLTSFIRAPIPPSMVFGAVNVVALAALAGSGAALFVVLLATALWATFRLPAARTGGTAIVATLVLATIFIFYKLMMEGGVVASWPGPVDGRQSTLFRVLAAVGFSYVFLRAWDVIASMQSAKVRLLDPLSLAGYLAPFHMLAAGPIGAYQQHVLMNDPSPRVVPFDGVLAAINGIATGLVFKFVIAEGLRIFAFGVNGTLTSRSWMDTALLFVYVFFDFAGYSRVARAIGTLNGVPTPVNFAAPFASPTITEFWMRWHMSLGAFVRRNIYLPLQLNLVRAAGLRWAHVVTIATLVVAFGFVGVWHRLTGHFILWGAGMGIVMAAEKVIRDHALAKWPWVRGRTASLGMALVGPVYVFVVITTSLHLVIQELLHA